MPYKDPEKRKTYHKTYNKAYKEKNKEYIKERDKTYRETPEGIKIRRISRWKQIGVIHEDYDELYDYYSLSTNCEYCWVNLVEGKYGSNKRALDHCHITGKMRGILCNTCNIKDVFKGK